ncbi:MAG TPA: hypothetical protein VKA70_11500 [Blastocatellia bacterium]|nr:hypothetical protein [Blastocatellia bacterium]
MSKNLKIIILLLICSAAVIGVGFWRYSVAGKSKAAHSVIIRDRSDSVPSGCDCTQALSGRAFSDPQNGAGSTVTVTVTGDATTAGEPKLVASVEVPSTRQVLEGRGASVQQKEKLLDDIKTACENMPQTKVSPILIAVKRGIEHLRSRGCGPESECSVYVQTDLEETGDPQLSAALKSTSGNKQALASPVNNEGIKIVITGIAETASISVGADRKVYQLTRPRNLQRIEYLQSVWKSLFSNPDRVTFEPHCIRERSAS